MKTSFQGRLGSSESCPIRPEPLQSQARPARPGRRGRVVIDQSRPDIPPGIVSQFRPPSVVRRIVLDRQTAQPRSASVKTIPDRDSIVPESRGIQVNPPL